MTPEGRVKKKLKEQLDKWGAYHFWPVPTGYGAATLDCLACVHPIFLHQRYDPLDAEFWGIECKREGVREPTPRQRETMRRIRAAGGRTWTVTLDGDALVWIEITT